MKKMLTLIAVLGVAMATSASAVLHVYEPFAYTSTTLSGQGGALGTTGTWSSYDSIGGVSWALHQEGVSSGVVLSDGVTPSTFDGRVANLETTGGYVGYNQGGNNLNAAISLDPSVTASFQVGTTTWISYVSARAWNLNAEHANLVLGTAPAPDGSRGDNYGGIGTGGSGFGTGGGPTRNNRTYIYPMFYRDGQYTNSVGEIPSNSYAQAAYEVPASERFPWVALNADGAFGAPNIVVMKIEWDADTGGEDIISVASFLETDTLSEANFDALIAAEPNRSSANWTIKPNLDQSQLNTITFMGVKYFVDEIRLGTTFESVTPIPEPGTIGLMGLFGLAAVVRRRLHR